MPIPDPETSPKIAGIRGEDAPDDGPEQNEHVLDVQVPVDLPGLALRAGHGAPDGRDMGVVPGVVVHDDGAVGHGGGLVPVVPPARHLRGQLRGLAKARGLKAWSKDDRCTTRRRSAQDSS